MRKAFFSSILILWVAGCVMPPELKEPLRISHDFNRSYDRVWRESIRMIAREGYFITATDKSSGLISYTIKINGSKIQAYAADASESTSYTRGSAIIQILIESDSPNFTKVTLFSRLNGSYVNIWTGKDELQEMTSKGEIEKQFFTKLSTALGEKKFEFLEKK